MTPLQVFFLLLVVGSRSSSGESGNGSRIGSRQPDVTGWEVIVERSERSASSEERKTRGERDLVPLSYHWQYQSPYGSATLLQPNGGFFNWVYTRPSGLPVYQPLPLAAFPDRVGRPAARPLHAASPLGPSTSTPPRLKPMFVPAGAAAAAGGQTPPGYPASTGPLAYAGRGRDEILVNDLYAARRAGVAATASSGPPPLYYEGPPPVSPSPQTQFLSSVGHRVPPRVGARPTGLPYSHVSYHSTPSPSPLVHVQRIAPSQRKGKQQVPYASTTVASAVSPPHNYHAPDQRLASFGHAIIHDKNE